MQLVTMVMHAAFVRQIIVVEDQLPLSSCLQSPGKLVRQLVQDGEHVTEGQAFAEIEVMKMIQTIASPAAGVISFQVSKGVQAIFLKYNAKAPLKAAQGLAEPARALKRQSPQPHCIFSFLCTLVQMRCR